MKVIVFQLNEQAYGVDIQQVRSIERMQKITGVPNTADFIKGVMNLRGETTPIIDLKERLRMPGQGETGYTDETRILIVYLDQFELGVLGEAPTKVVDSVATSLEPAPVSIGGVHEAYLNGVA